MPYFRDAAHLYQVLDQLFRRLSQQPSIVEALIAGRFVLRFRYTSPEAQVTVDMRQAPLTWVFGETNLKPDLEMIQAADTAHMFWLGRLNVTRAIATRQVVSRGPLSKALKLLPAVKPAFPIYAQMLREEGHEDLLPQELAAPGWWDQLTLLLDRWQRRISLSLPSRRKIELSQLNTHAIPLQEAPRIAPISYRDQQLPVEEPALKLEMLRRMLLIRAFEDCLAAAFARGELPTQALHLSVGQEAVAVGVCFSLRSADYIATTHRGHGHMLAKGADLDGMMAELLGKATGLCGGKGGSMHVTDAAVGALGANGIVGASPLIAAGAAHSARQRGSGQIAVAFMGDGATNQGMFHEALNLAAVLDLPAVFVVENNLYGEFTPQHRHMRTERISSRAAAYGMPGETVDGNDVWEVFQAARRAVDRARRGAGPTLLECLTYRWRGHMEGEEVDYRPVDEIARWRERCPIGRWRSALCAAGLLDVEGAEEIEGSTKRAVQECLDRARRAPGPAATALQSEVYAPEPAYLYRVEPGAAGEVASRPSGGDREISCSQALFEALAEEMTRDEQVYLIGEDVTTGGYFSVTVGLSDRFGGERVVDTPISEYAIVGSAVGAAMTGRRPVVEILFSDFLTTCCDPLVNQAAKLRYMSGGQYTIPLVVRTPGGAGLGLAAQHSQSLEALFTGIPGLIVIAPATPHDAKGLLKAAIRSNNPVLFFENKLLYATTGPVPEGDYTVPIGVAEVTRPGRDVTVVSVGAALGKALEGAAQLATEGLEPEVVDLRTLQPLDLATIVRSVVRTGRLVTVEDAPLTHGFGAEVVARVAEAARGALRAPPRRVAARDVPIPYNTALENAALPDAGDVQRVVRDVLRWR